MAEMKIKVMRIAELRSEISKRDSLARALEEKIRKALFGLEEEGITMEMRSGKVYISLDNELLFKPGSYTADEKGKTASIKIDDFNPFFYVQVPSTWGSATKNKFLNHLKTKLGSYYADSIINAGKEYKFISIKFKNTRALSKCKNLWYNISKDPDRPGWNKYRLKENGYTGYAKTSLRIYEAVIPPILRLFHILKV